MRAMVGVVLVLVATIAQAQDIYPTKELGRFSSDEVRALLKDNTKLLLDRFQPVVVNKRLKIWDDPSVPSSGRTVYLEKLGLVQHLPRTYYYYVTDYSGLKAFLDIRDILPEVKLAFSRLYNLDNLEDYSASGMLKIQRMGPLLRVNKGLNVLDFVNIEYYEDSSFFSVSSLLDDRYVIVKTSWYEHQHYSIYDLDKAVEVFKCLSEAYFSPDRTHFITFGAVFYPPKVLQLFSYKAGQLKELQQQEMDVKWEDTLLSITWSQSNVSLEIGATNSSDRHKIRFTF
jgi:hypothetical protein